MRVTPLDSAAAGGSAEILRLLVETGAPMNASSAGRLDRPGRRRGKCDVEMVKTLVEYGGHPLIVNDEGKTPAWLEPTRGTTKPSKFSRNSAAQHA